MKTIVLIAFVLCNMQGMKAQISAEMENSPDKTAITQALENYYFRGIYGGDTDILNQIFNTGTLLFGDVKGVPYAKTLDQYLEGVKNRQSPKDAGTPFKCEIIALKVVKSIAMAEVRVKMYDYDYYDLLSLHKIDGKWLIVNKMMSDVKQ